MFLFISAFPTICVVKGTLAKILTNLQFYEFTNLIWLSATKCITTKTNITLVRGNYTCWRKYLLPSPPQKRTWFYRKTIILIVDWLLKILNQNGFIQGCNLTLVVIEHYSGSKSVKGRRILFTFHFMIGECYKLSLSEIFK